MGGCHGRRTQCHEQVVAGAEILTPVNHPCPKYIYKSHGAVHLLFF